MAWKKRATRLREPPPPARLLGGGGPAAVHDIVCEFVAAQAEAESEASGGWAGYREVFLSAEVQGPQKPKCSGVSAGDAKRLQ